MALKANISKNLDVTKTMDLPSHQFPFCQFALGLLSLYCYRCPHGISDRYTDKIKLKIVCHKTNMHNH